MPFASPYAFTFFIYVGEKSSTVKGGQGASNTESSSTLVKALTSLVSKRRGVLFATVCVNVRDCWGNKQKCRILLDSASEANFIADACVKRLGLSKVPTVIPNQGLNQMSSQSNSGVVMCNVLPISKTHPQFELKCFVLPTICGNLPSMNMSPI